MKVVEILIRIHRQYGNGRQAAELWSSHFRNMGKSIKRINEAGEASKKCFFD